MLMNFVYITDEKYVIPTTVSIQSIIQSMTKKKKKIYVLCDCVSEYSKSNLEYMVDESTQIILIDVDGESYSEMAEKVRVKTGSYVSRCALCKFDLPILLNDVNVVLYMDSDTLMIGDCEELFNIDIADNYLAAAKDMGDGKNWGGISYAERIGLNEYFNSGVMLLNLDKMRQDKTQEKLMFYRINGKNHFMDQDALNVIMGEKRVNLDIKYNFMTSMLDIKGFDRVNSLFFNNRFFSEKQCISEQIIIHCAGGIKPWDYYLFPTTDKYLEYYYLSPYRNIPIYPHSFSSFLYSENERLINENTRLMDELKRVSEEIEYLCMRSKSAERRFPTDKLQHEDQIVLYGAGKFGRAYKRILDRERICHVALWVDSNYRNIDERNVTSPEAIKNVEYDYIVVAMSRKNDIKSAIGQIKAMGIEENKILCDFNKQSVYEEE